MAVDPILRFSNGTDIVDILTPNSGWKMANPYWNPQIAQYKSGGIKINSALAEGQRLVHKEYDNVVETIPLTLSGTDQDRALKTLSDLLSLSRQSADYWAETYEFDDVWMQVQIACSSCYSGYARIVQMKIPELINPFGQPFFSAFNEAVMEGISLIVEREPLWRAIPPGEVIGPIYNLIQNPDFELWNFGITDSQPDSWTDLETIQITGTNNRESTSPHSGNFCLRVRVSGSTLTGRIKGVTQTLTNIKPSTTYTVVAWVRSEGVSNGVGRILVTYSGQLQLYRDNARHGWTLYTGTFTTGLNDTVGINCEILSTAANTVGTIYFDSLMLFEGDLEQEAIDGVLPYLSSSRLVNHQDTATGVIEASDINYLDVWDMPGNEDALVRLEVVNNTTPANIANPSELIAALRVGMRRAGDVFNLQNFQDPPGPVDTASSGNTRVVSGTLSTTVWTTVATQTIQTPTITQDNAGRYRLFVRAFDIRTTGILTLQLRIQYWVGSGDANIKTLDAVTVPILNNWCIVDLTPSAAINWDTKFSPNPVSQFGFNIQMKRTANTDAGRIDYALLLPGDGGMLIADIDPAVSQNDGVIVDCTGVSSKVYAAHVISQWKVSTQVVTGSTDVQQLVAYSNALFMRSGTFIFKYFNNSTTKFSTVAQAIAVYNGRLISVDLNTGYSSDGTSFPGSSVFTFSLSVIRAIFEYGGYLYISGQDAATLNAVIRRWDGTSATATTLVQRADITEFLAMQVYQGELFVVGEVGGANRVYRLNLTTNVLTLSLTTASASNFTDFTVFGDKLWYTDRGANIYSFDGSTWTTQSPFPALSPNYRGINSIDGTLFVTGRDTASSPNKILIIKSTDGTTWTIDYNPPNTGATNLEGTQLAKFQGQLWMGTTDNVATTHNIYSKSISANEYTVSDYQLVPFASPPKKRHRFIFNWDRPGDINNIDDRILVGYACVPRYLALRGRF